jgi:2'-5' RNA ligase
MSAGGARGIRAFFAVDLDEATRAAAADVVRALRREPGADGVRWVRPEALHVTLRFLGAVEPTRLRSLAHGVAGEVAELSPFALRLGAVQLFPSSRRPRVVGLEVAPADQLDALAAAVERGVQAQGFAAEKRPFRPHLTLGRIQGRGARAPRTPATPVEAACEVAEVVLFRSDLHRSGARYTPLERVLLGTARAAGHP